MNKDIFLSYCRNDRINVKKIYDGLREKGYKVWFDDVDVKGKRIDDAIIEGIDNSEVFLMAVSSGYQYSVNCRHEFDYAENKQKIVVIVEEGYKLIGWLKYWVGKENYTRMSKVSLENLLKEVIDKMSGKESVGKQAVSTKELAKVEDVGKQLLAPLTNKWNFFLSYCHDGRSNVEKIYDGLGEKGYKVWLDDVEMKGCRVDDAIIEGIDNSEVFLMAVSSGYQKSGSCRHEFDYAQQKQKTVVIVIVEEEYQMGGWMEFHLSKDHYTRVSLEDVDAIG